MSYLNYLASRGYRRATVERSSDTAKPGHFVLTRVDRPALRVEGEVAGSVVRMKGRGR